MKDATIRCPACNGNGKTPLKPKLKRCFDAINRLGNPSVPEIFKELHEPVDHTAINQRVRRLVGFRLVKRTNKQHPPRYSVME